MSAEQRLRGLLDGDRVVSPLSVAQDAALLDPIALGRLMPDAMRLAQSAPPGGKTFEAAQAILERGRAIAPRYDADSAREALATLNALAAADLADARPGIGRSWEAATAAEVVEGLAGDLTPTHRALIGKLADLLAQTADPALRTALLAIARPGARPEVETSPLHRIELDLIADLGADRPAAAISAARAVAAWSDAMDDDAIPPPGEYPLARLDGFVTAARPAIESTAAQIAAVQSGATAYAADKALPYDDAHALSRFVSVALDRDEPWLAAMLEPLLAGVAIAPAPTVKTAPSQAAAIGLAKAIAERPTLAAAAALKATASVTRHAGLQKKLERLAKVAERRLAARPDLIAGLTPGAVIPKSLLPAIRKSFEHLYLSGRGFERPVFEAAILATKGVAEIAQALVWIAVSDAGARVSVQPAKARAGHAYLDAHGDAVALAADTTFHLWHPLTAAPGEAEAWQARIGENQPFNQLSRETYAVPTAARAEVRLDRFAGHVVDIRRLMGLALSAGWITTRYDGFRRTANGLTFTFYCGDLFPGAEGETRTGDLFVARDGAPLAWGAVDAVLASEVLRSADLLASVA